MIFAAKTDAAYGNYTRCSCDDAEEQKQCAGYESAIAPVGTPLSASYWRWCKHSYDSHGIITDACYRKDILILREPPESESEETEQ